MPKNNLSSKNSCKKFNNTYPDFSPVILSISPDTSATGEYTQVNVFGQNFTFGSRIGYTIIKFGNINLPVTFYGSNNISFIVPSNARPGVYTVQALNAFYPTSTYSNIINYTVV